MVNVKKKLPELSHDEIRAHILDPKNNPLPEHQKEQFDRVLQAARMLDEYPDTNHLIKMLQYKYNCGATTARRDIELARQFTRRGTPSTGISGTSGRYATSWNLSVNARPKEI